MAAEDVDAGLFNISLSDSDADAGASSEADKRGTKADRTALSEDAFLALKAEYRVKVENGELWKTVQLPLRSKLSKPGALALVHAAEELYFYHRYEEAASFAERVLDPESKPGGLDNETRELLGHYREKCLSKAIAKVSGDLGPTEDAI